MGGAMFLYGSRVIAIDPEWPFKDNELLLTVEHEYGHALGLPHRYGDSIMKPGWDPPFASGPTEEDFSDLRRIGGAKSDLGGQHDRTYARGDLSPEPPTITNIPKSVKGPSEEIMLAITHVIFSGHDAFTWLTQRVPRRAPIRKPKPLRVRVAQTSSRAHAPADESYWESVVVKKRSINAKLIPVI
jgi:hypothetical protein